MTEVSEAYRLLQAHCPPPQVQTLKLQEAAGHVLAADVEAPIDSPPFDQSAMDGYAIRYSDYREGQIYRVAGSVQAGDTGEFRCAPGEVLRIFTGAAVPEDFDTVIPQEYAEQEAGMVSFQHPTLQAGDNVRPRGSQVFSGTALPVQGRKLSPGLLGYLATLGLSEVKVYKRPRIGLLITGRELVKPGTMLLPGQVYESNGDMLQAALDEGRLETVFRKHAEDEPDATLHGLRGALAVSDVVLCTGGISVGEHDYVRGALEQAGVQTLFHNVKQKPGKPLYAGLHGKQLVFALPGNPAAVLTCFYRYVAPCLRALCGLPFMPPLQQRPLLHDWTKKGTLTHFLKARRSGDGVLLLEGQESYKLHSFADADCLLTIPADVQAIKAGTLCETLILNNVWQAE